MVQDLGIVGTHVTDSDNNLQSSIMAGVKNLIQVFHSYLCLCASASIVVTHQLLPLSMYAMDREN
jgi:hypothetical protein